MLDSNFVAWLLNLSIPKLGTIVTSNLDHICLKLVLGLLDEYLEDLDGFARPLEKMSKHI